MKYCYFCKTYYKTIEKHYSTHKHIQNEKNMSNEDYEMNNGYNLNDDDFCETMNNIQQYEKVLRDLKCKLKRRKLINY